MLTVKRTRYDWRKYKMANVPRHLAMAICRDLNRGPTAMELALEKKARDAAKQSAAAHKAHEATLAGGQS